MGQPTVPAAAAGPKAITDTIIHDGLVSKLPIKLKARGSLWSRGSGNKDSPSGNPGLNSALPSASWGISSKSFPSEPRFHIYKVKIIIVTALEGLSSRQLP